MSATIKNTCKTCGRETLLNFKSKGNKSGDYICIKCLMDFKSKLYNPQNKKPDFLGRASDP